MCCLNGPDMACQYLANESDAVRWLPNMIRNMQSDGVFPKIGVPLNYPFINGMFPYKPLVDGIFPWK